MPKTANPPGEEFTYIGTPYGFGEHLTRYGNGDNLLRTDRCAQPGALQIDDVLATSDKVYSLPREGGNGGVWIQVSNDIMWDWLRVPARIPIALASKDGKFALPEDLRVGKVIATGERILSPPRKTEDGSIQLHLTGGFDGHRIEVPAKLPIALATEEEVRLTAAMRQPRKK